MIDRCEIICRVCGLIIEEAMPEQCQYSEQHYKNNDLNIAGTGTTNGKIVKAGWMLSNKEKNFRRAKRLLNRVASRLNLPKYVVENSKRIYLETIERQLSVGRSIKGIMLASIYISCKQHDIPKTISEIIRRTEVSFKEFNYCLKAIKTSFNLSLPNMSPLDLMERHMNQMGFDFKAREYAVTLYAQLQGKVVIQGRNPKSVASAILYITSVKRKLGISQREISHRVDVVETTLRKCYKEITQKYNQIR